MDEYPVMVVGVGPGRFADAIARAADTPGAGTSRIEVSMATWLDGGNEWTSP